MTDSNQRSVIDLFIELNRLIARPEVSTDSVRKFLEENGLSRETYVQTLVDPNCLQGTRPTRKYPPVLAVELENFEKLDVLISHGYQLQDCEVSETDDILANTCRKGKYAVVKTLIEKYDVNVNGVTGKMIPLHEAVEACCIDIVEYLIEKGVPVDTVDDRGRNVLHVAADRFLLPFRPKDLPSFEKLILRGVDVNQRDRKGNTPLHYAAANAHVGVVHACIKAGADVIATCIMEGKSKTALDVALEGYRYLHRSGSIDEDEKAFCHIIMSLIHAGSDVTRINLLEILMSNFKQSTFASFIQKLYRWTNDLKSKPRSLRDLCIFKIRKELSGRLLSAAEQLPLPPSLQSMLRLEHVIPNEHDVVS